MVPDIAEEPRRLGVRLRLRPALGDQLRGAELEVERDLLVDEIAERPRSGFETKQPPVGTHSEFSAPLR